MGDIWMWAVLFILIMLMRPTHGLTEEESDRITALPGQPAVHFQQFSGYVTVNKEAGRALFYWLTEAATIPLSKPLVVWLNGGPGCSSVAYGASEEIGPFRIKRTGSELYRNRFAWNTEANLLFVETPAGVGFSYTNRSSDLLDTGDRRTAADTLEFLTRWLERFPRYQTRDVFLTGESYAGYYVPQLAKHIMDYNAAASNRQPKINLKGIMVGNAVMDNYYDNLGTVMYWWSHAMISDRTYQQLMSSCNFRQPEVSSECDSIFSYAMGQEFGHIDPYNIYAPPCNATSKSNGVRHVRRRRPRIPHRPHSNFRKIAGYDPCTENYAELYFNRPDVQSALHANTTKIPYKWTSCSDALNNNWNDTVLSVLPIYREMMASGLRVWVYSGDVDSVVPVTATRQSLHHLKLATKVPWYPWYVDKQVGGWTEVYEGLTFATVRGAGHEVPLIKPRSGLQLFRSFLRGEPLPRSQRHA